MSSLKRLIASCLVIRLRRGQKPAILVANEQAWTAEYLRLRAGDPNVPQAAATRYRHPDIKAQVKADSYNKCIYCESCPLHVSPGAVEHILPKAHFPNRVVDWTNLGFVCTDCNTTKGDYQSDTEPIVDPFHEEPERFIRFAGALVFEQPGERRGIVTIRKLGLHRGELVERRADHLRGIQTLLNSWAQMPQGPARDEVAEEIRERAADSGEYAAATRAFLATVPDFPVTS